MSKTKPGLGRGLDALINPKVKDEVDKPLSVSSEEIKSDDGKSVDVLAKAPADKIDSNPFQPRTDFDEEALDELKKSILENGLIQPVTVRRMDDGRYQLISGERRLRACIDIGYKEIPSYIVQVDSKEAMLALSLIENIQREKLNAIEIAEAYKRLLEECRLSQEEVATKLGKNRTTITNSIRLLKLPKQVRESIAKEEISAGHARALINLPSEEMQVELVNKIKKSELSVRKVENLVKQYTNNRGKNKSKRFKDNSDKTKETHQKDLESKLRTVFGTKVLCKQRSNGAGEITIEFYSNDELERLLELFEVIEKADY